MRRKIILIVAVGILFLLQGCVAKAEFSKYERRNIDNVSSTILTDNLDETLPMFLKSVFPLYKQRIITEADFEKYTKSENMEHDTVYLYPYERTVERVEKKQYSTLILIKTHDDFNQPIQFSISTNTSTLGELNTECSKVKNKNANFTYNSYDLHSGDVSIGIKNKNVSERCYLTEESPKEFHYEYAQIKYALADAFLKQTNLS